MGILQRLNAEGKTIVVVTHDAKVAQYSQRVLELCDGSVLRDELVRRNEVDIRPAELDAGAPPPPPGQQVCFKCNAGNRQQARYCANCGASWPCGRKSPIPSCAGWRGCRSSARIATPATGPLPGTV